MNGWTINGWDWSWEIAGTIADVLLFPVVAILLVQNIIYFLQLYATWRERMSVPLRVGTDRDLWALSSRQALPVSVIAPAFNEELTIDESLRSLLSINYPEFEVVVVNDGSKDNTLAVLQEKYNLVPRNRPKTGNIPHQPVSQVYGSLTHKNLTVVDKANGRKADASNAGINYAQHPLVCVIDADSLIETDALLRVTQPFLGDDGSIIAVGGNIRLTNGCSIFGGRLRSVGFPKEWIAKFQVLEYLRAFMVARVSASRWSMMMLISGAFGVFRRDAMVRVGGFAHDSVGEDLELVVRMHKDSLDRGIEGKVMYVADANCWTEAPFNYEGISNQRARWTQGGIEVLVKYREMLFNPKYGKIGMMGLPMVLLETALVPIAEVLAYILMPVLWATGRTTTPALIAVVVISLLVGTLISLLAIAFEEMQQRHHTKMSHIFQLVLLAFIESIGYRQMNTWFRIRGFWRWKSNNNSWAAVPRQGFTVDSN